MSELPPPRRIIAAHHSSGTPHIIDETLPTVDAGGGFRISQLFVQREFHVKDMTKIAEEGSKGATGSKVEGGVATRFVGMFVLNFISSSLWCMMDTYVDTERFCF